jgi:hypothetical protein
MDIRLGVLAARGYIATRRMKVRKRPMHKIEVKVLKAKVCK